MNKCLARNSFKFGRLCGAPKNRRPLHTQGGVIVFLADKPQPRHNVVIRALNLFPRCGEKQVAIASVFRRKSSRREEHGDRSATHIGMAPTGAVPPPRLSPDRCCFLGR